MCSRGANVMYGVLFITTFITHHSHYALGGYSKLTNGLRVAASGAFVC